MTFQPSTLSDHAMLRNPKGGGRKKAKRKEKRMQNAEKYAAKHGIPVEEAVTKMKARARERKKKGGRKGKEAAQEVEELEELEYEEGFESEDFDDDDEEGGMNPMIIAAGVAALALGAVFFLRR